MIDLKPESNWDIDRRIAYLQLKESEKIREQLEILNAKLDKAFPQPKKEEEPKKLEELPYKDLQSMAKEKGIKNYYKLSKVNIIKQLVDDEEKHKKGGK